MDLTTEVGKTDTEPTKEKEQTSRRTRPPKPAEVLSESHRPPIAEELLTKESPGDSDAEGQLKMEAPALVADKYQHAPMDLGDALAVIVRPQDLSAAIEALRAELRDQIVQATNTLRSEMTTDNGLFVEMVGGVFNCPKCGLRLNAPSTTAQRGQTFEHPFDTSPKLGGIQCELKGRKFVAPMVFLKFAPVPTPKA